MGPVSVFSPLYLETYKFKEIWLHHSLINPLKPEKDGKNNEFSLQGEGKYDLEY